MCFSRMFRKIKEINSHPLTHLLWVIIPSVIINNGNMMKCSLIRSVIIRVIDKIGWPRSASPISSSLVLSPINQNYGKIWERKSTSIIRFHKKRTIYSAKYTTTARADFSSSFFQKKFFIFYLLFIHIFIVFPKST